MTLLVPFDGSTLAEAALDRAVEFGGMVDESVQAVVVIPQGNVRYARKRGWIADDEPFDVDAVVSRIREQVQERAPDASLRVERVPRAANTGSIARKIRGIAREVGPSLLFVGSDNAGRLVTTLSSVGGNVASDRRYDVMIVRHGRAARTDSAADGAAE